MVLGTWNRVNQPSICHFKLLHSLKTLSLASRTWNTLLIFLFSCRPLLLCGPCSILPYLCDVGRMEVSLQATPLVRGGAGVPMPGTPPPLRGRASWVWAHCSSRGTAMPSLLPSQARVPKITTRGTHRKRDFPHLLPSATGLGGWSIGLQESWILTHLKHYGDCSDRNSSLQL